MGNGSGVSLSELPGGRWRVRWREVVEVDGRRDRRQRERVVNDLTTAEVVKADILRALERNEVFDPEPAARVVARTTTVDDVFAGWLVAQRARGLAPSTIEGYAGHIDRALRGLRTAVGLRHTAPVPAAELTRDRVIALVNTLRDEGVSDAVLNKMVGVVVQAWTWAGDDPDEYPGLRPAPRDVKALKPRAPTYSAPPHPTLAECDAVIRRVAAMPRTGNVALPVVVIARWTGLRVAQIMAIRVVDVDLPGRALVVSKGKGRRETAERRRIPITTELRDWLAPYVARAQDEGRDLLFLRRSDAARKRSGEPRSGKVSNPDRTVRRAWEAATAAGEARREVWDPAVWDPESRRQSRPDHAFRAALQAALVVVGVRDEVIDALVGHVGGVRARHYVLMEDARATAMRAAVDLLPPIDWRGPGAAEDEPDNVVQLRRG
jgi:integrase